MGLLLFGNGYFLEKGVLFKSRVESGGRGGGASNFPN